jgi:hypothetical protein
VLLPFGAAGVPTSERLAVLVETESVDVVTELPGDLPAATDAAVPGDDVDEAAVGDSGTEGDLGATLHALTAANSAAAPAHRTSRCVSL